MEDFKNEFVEYDKMKYGGEARRLAASFVSTSSRRAAVFVATFLLLHVNIRNYCL